MDINTNSVEKFMESFDGSYSCITGFVQGSEELGSDLIQSIVLKVSEKQLEMDKAQEELYRLKDEKSMYLGGLRNAVKHLKMDLPLVVPVRPGKVIIIDKELDFEEFNSIV